MKLEVSNVVKRFGMVTAVNGLSIDAGENWNCLGILGRNGAGKTTFLRMLVGLLQPDSGGMALTYNNQKRSYADPVSATYVSDQCRLIGRLTGVEHFRLYEAMNQLIGVGTDVNLKNDLIERLVLGDHVGKAIRRMSKGTRRKLEVICAVSSNVPLVVADELTEGLDFPSRVVLEELITSLSRSGKRFIVSSHDLSFITSISDRIAIIDHGVCVALIDDVNKGDFKARAMEVFERAAPEEGAAS